MLVNRRTLFPLAAGGAAALALPRARAADARPVRITLPGPGSAGALWRPLIEALPAETLQGIDLQWIGGDPGQAQMHLLSGAIDVGVFGATGLVDARARGGDVVIFGPALNNHGRWIVRADSPFHSPADLKGRRIASQPMTTETYRQASIAASLIGIDLAHDMKIVFGPPVANLALFERGDVDGVIELEPVATRMVGRGAREIARVGAMWHDGTGGSQTPFLVGLTAQRSWLDANRDIATRIARIFTQVNRALAEQPQKIAGLHAALGVPDTETAVIGLLPERMQDVYGAAWDAAVWAQIDKQVEVAVKLGLIAAKPARPLYDATPLG